MTTAWRNGLIYVSMFLVGTLLLPGCTSSSQRTLYDDLGGSSGIDALVEEFLYVLADDERIVHFFDETDIDRFQEKLSEQLCFESGGPCEYTGDDMVAVHKGMDINASHFNALVEDLIVAMENKRIPTATQNRLLAILAPMHDDIRYADERATGGSL